jgi:hypothetical protein
MKRVTGIIIAMGALLAPAALVSSQTSPGLINKLEVQKLVADGSPAATATLATHFAALADRYATEAAQHKTMAQAYTANANRAIAPGLTAHCARLADLATESAAAAREMATYHEELAYGKVATAPKNAGRLNSGAGAPEPTAVDLHHLAMTARTPADHRSLEEYFTTIASRNVADAETHVAMAQAYRASVRKGGDPAAHCDRLVKLSREAAKEATAAAATHRQLATIG